MREFITALLRSRLARYEVVPMGGVEELLEAVSSGRVSVLVLDVRLAYGHVVGLVRRLKAQAPSTRILLLIEEMGQEYCEAADADAWLDKGQIFEALPALVRRLARKRQPAL